ncbi:GGDEF-domain containing protein [Sesbania bispinosa]|nr:GGDEF-domain containing protein [Sesbania bispinosa]
MWMAADTEPTGRCHHTTYDVGKDGGAWVACEGERCRSGNDDSNLWEGKVDDDGATIGWKGRENVRDWWPGYNTRRSQQRLTRAARWLEVVVDIDLRLCGDRVGSVIIRCWCDGWMIRGIAAMGW